MNVQDNGSTVILDCRNAKVYYRNNKGSLDISKDGQHFVHTTNRYDEYIRSLKEDVKIAI